MPAASYGRDCAGERLGNYLVPEPEEVRTETVDAVSLLRERGSSQFVPTQPLFYAYMVDNQAIVIPETISAIRAPTGTISSAEELIAKLMQHSGSAC